MKPGKAGLEKLLDSGGGDCRVFLFYGPDEAGSRTLIQRLARALGPTAERVEIDGAGLKADPARLADEAAALSLFGDKRYIVMTLGGHDDPTAALESILSASRAGNPVILLAGALKAGSALVKRLQDEPHAAIHASYVPDEREFAEIATALAREQGMRVGPEIARRLVALAGQDRAVMAQEITKLALYLNADTANPHPVDTAALEAIGADSGEPDLSELADAVFGGKPEKVTAQLAALSAEGVDGIALIRALNRRMQTLLKLRGEMAAGKPVDGLVASLFWKEKGPVSAQLRRWSPERLAKAADRLITAERAIKASGSAGPILAQAALIEIARAGQR